MPDQDQTASHTAPDQEAAAPPSTAFYEPADGGEVWIDEPEELPRRPRRRLLTPLPLALMAVLLIACGFIGGVLVEKGQSSSSSSGASASGRAARAAALAGGSASASGSSGAGASGSSGAGFPGAGTDSAGRTVGQVAYLDGSTIYVTNPEGTTVKVGTSAATTVSKTVKSSVAGVHPGETVTVRGTPGSGGSISAETVTVGSGSSGLAGIFGGAGSGSTTGSTGSSSTGAGGQSLFGAG
jgi:hypothetical protein